MTDPWWMIELKSPRTIIDLLIMLVLALLFAYFGVGHSRIKNVFFPLALLWALIALIFQLKWKGVLAVCQSSEEISPEDVFFSKTSYVYGRQIPFHMGTLITIFFGMTFAFVISEIISIACYLVLRRRFMKSTDLNFKISDILWFAALANGILLQVKVKRRNQQHNNRRDLLQDNTDLETSTRTLENSEGGTYHNERTQGGESRSWFDWDSWKERFLQVSSFMAWTVSLLIFFVVFAVAADLLSDTNASLGLVQTPVRELLIRDTNLNPSTLEICLQGDNTVTEQRKEAFGGLVIEMSKITPVSFSWSLLGTTEDKTKQSIPYCKEAVDPLWRAASTRETENLTPLFSGDLDCSNTSGACRLSFTNKSSSVPFTLNLNNMATYLPFTIFDHLHLAPIFGSEVTFPLAEKSKPNSTIGAMVLITNDYSREMASMIEPFYGHILPCIVFAANGKRGEKHLNKISYATGEVVMIPYIRFGILTTVWIILGAIILLQTLYTWIRRWISKRRKGGRGAQKKQHEGHQLLDDFLTKLTDSCGFVHALMHARTTNPVGSLEKEFVVNEDDWLGIEYAVGPDKERQVSLVVGPSTTAAVNEMTSVQSVADGLPSAPPGSGTPFLAPVTRPNFFLKKTL
ncbi:hypothetical protein HK102_003471 [Quaeritorhiza haematococci]|nr:hypothetical protein HK102_003471 [Quaeritorhiza haematococci]